MSNAEIVMGSETNIEEQPKPKTRKTRMILGIVIFIVGLLVLAGGISVFVYNLDTDNEGYTDSNIYHVNTSAYAFTLYMNKYEPSAWSFLGVENVAKLKFIVKATNSTKELFTGYATTAESESYRKSFECEIPTYWHWYAESYYAEILINTTVIEGTGAPPTLPQAQTFWRASAHSTSTAEMTYLPLHEQHIWFIMNLDGSKNITADIQIAYKSPSLSTLPFVLLPLGIVLVGAGVYLLRRKK
jgi:hypothetical protein